MDASALPPPVSSKLPAAHRAPQPVVSVEPCKIPLYPPGPPRPAQQAVPVRVAPPAAAPTAAPRLPPPPPPPPRVAKCRVDEALRRLLAALCTDDSDEAAVAVPAGLQAAVYMWTHVQRDDDPAGGATAAERLRLSANEAQMGGALAAHLCRCGAAERDVLLLCGTAEQVAATRSAAEAAGCSKELRVLNLASAAPEDLAAEWVISSCGHPSTLHRRELEAPLVDALILAASRRSGFVFLGSTAFVRTASAAALCDDEPTWRRGWRAAIQQLQDSSFRCRGPGQELILGRVCLQLPLCCPRHPTVHEEAAVGEGFPAGFCPYPCLQRYAGCTAAAHLCVQRCHAGAHERCPYPSARILPCGHPDRRLCGEPPDCGQARRERMGCCSVRLKGWDPSRFRVVSGVEPHWATIPCGKTKEEVLCTEPVTSICPRCRGDVVTPCHEKKSKSSRECPHCLRAEQEARQEVRAALIRDRAGRRVEQQQRAHQLKLQQADAAQKGIFVDGQKVMVIQPEHEQSPADFEAAFGDRKWMAGPVQAGTFGTVRGRANHPRDIALLVYLIEAAGQEYCILSGKGLSLCSAVSELPPAHGGVLLITASDASVLRVGEWAAYEPPVGEAAADGLFPQADFAAADSAEYAAVRAAGGSDRFYGPADPPPRGRLFAVEGRLRHPDGSSVHAALCKDVGKGESGGKWLLAREHVFRRPLQKGQKVIVADPARTVHSEAAGVQKKHPSVAVGGGWFDGSLARNDTGTVVGVTNLARDGDPEALHYLVRMDIRNKVAVLHSRGVDTDEEGERLRKEDEQLFQSIDRKVAEEMPARIAALRERNEGQRVAEAKLLEETRATRAAAEAAAGSGARSEGGELLSAAQRAEKEAELRRLREDGERKRKRLREGETERCAANLALLKRRRAPTQKDAPQWATEAAQGDRRSRAEGGTPDVVARPSRVAPPTAEQARNLVAKLKARRPKVPPPPPAATPDTQPLLE
eukprot:TRINITY_DN25694_c0_g1_i1.p1 TRINITY_DN25694_c0_g1~~TRINITY_DN25694_c0_g1_i1.p1  ORF type:complete len:1009 (+),score=284.74 TRINITY_DN25694_c0_g1_i1:83-3028(+)